MGPMGPIGGWPGRPGQKSVARGRRKRETLFQGNVPGFLALKKLRFRGRDPSRKIRAAILRRSPVRMPRDLLWRPIW